MDTKEFLAIVFKPVWTWIIGGIFAIIGVATFFIPDLGTVLNWPALSAEWHWALLGGLALFIWAIGIAWEAASRVYKEPPELQELMKLRTEGVVLRNSADAINTRDKLDVFIKDHKGWERRMLAVVSKLSKSAAEELETLDTFELLVKPTDFNDKQAKYRSMLSAQIERLKTFVDDFRRFQK